MIFFKETSQESHKTALFTSHWPEPSEMAKPSLRGWEISSPSIGSMKIRKRRRWTLGGSSRPLHTPSFSTVILAGLEALMLRVLAFGLPHTWTMSVAFPCSRWEAEMLSNTRGVLVGFPHSSLLMSGSNINQHECLFKYSQVFPIQCIFIENSSKHWSNLSEWARLYCRNSLRILVP